MRHFLRMRDLERGEIRRLFARAAELKRRRREGHLEDSLAGKTVVLVMEKASTRTRLSFAAAAFQLGGHAIELSASTSQLARGEPLSDTARVISGYADAVVMRTTADARLEEFVRWSSVPVINGLTDGGHPVQVLTDLSTVPFANERTVVTIGAYDGVHIGHQFVIDQVRRSAASLDRAIQY